MRIACKTATFGGDSLDEPVVLPLMVGAVPHEGDRVIQVPLLPFAVRLPVHSCTTILHWTYLITTDRQIDRQRGRQTDRQTDR